MINTATTNATLSENGKCLNCQTQLHGKFCYECGEKVIEQDDYSIKGLMNQSIGAIFSLDSKLLRSLFYVILKPGKLTKEYVNGKRLKFMRPFQLFVVANLLFFILMPGSDIFRIPSQYYFKQRNVQEKVEIISKNKDISIKELAVKYNDTSLSWSKTGLALTIPFIGILMFLINFRKKYYFGKHIIFATHFMSFFLIYLSLLGFFNDFIYTINPENLEAPIIIAILIYASWSIKIFYQDNMWFAILKGVMSSFLIVMILVLYRNFISFSSLYFVS